MRTLLNLLKSDILYSVGLALLVLGSLLFSVPMEGHRFDFLSVKFVFSYVSFIGFWIAVMVDNKRVTGKKLKFYNLSHNIMLLLLANLSAYSLNLSINVFETSVLWLSVFLIILNVVLAVIGLRKNFRPDMWNYFSVAVLSAGFLLQLYQSIFVIPILPMGAIAFLFFGISLHIFVPLWFSAQLFRILKKYVLTSNNYWKSIIVGSAIPLVFLLGFAVHWNGVKINIHESYQDAVAPLETDDLPSWVKAGQRIDDNWMVRRILNTKARNAFGWGWRRAGFFENEKWYHDPMIVIASLIGGDEYRGQRELEKINNIFLESQHKTEPRLWSGNMLSTGNIITNIQLFPEYRLAYTEKTFIIKHSGKRLRSEEAIYSFYLPEGAAVTSASLWVEGEERPAYLTTKSKAEKAYKTIVGVERRDPLLVTWQEDNRVTARVFPCTADNPRQFKIGFTAPLKLNGDMLVYENIDFDGPDKSSALETVRVLKDSDKMLTSSDFKFKNKGSYAEHIGKYKESWEMNLKAPPLSEEVFTFNGRSFQLKSFETYFEPMNHGEVYLDINKGWTKKEFNKIWELVKGENVFACNGGLIKLTEENKNDVFAELNDFNFSIFPFQKIHVPANSVVITKAAGPSPLPANLGDCSFAKNMSTFFHHNDLPIKTINIEEDMSPYIKTLKEIRALQVYSCELKEGLKLLKENKFPSFQEDEKTIVIEQAGMKIIRLLNVEEGDQAPDHLLRLFIYNDLMTEIGKSYFNKKYLEDRLAEKTKEANVVSPVSSLVTLETQEDYDRFDIKAPGENSLKNASINQSGAVPEPHEWILIFICLAFAVFVYRSHPIYWVGSK